MVWGICLEQRGFCSGGVCEVTQGMVGSEHLREEGVDSGRESHASRLAVCLPPFLPVHSPCCFALGGCLSLDHLPAQPMSRGPGLCELS